MTVAEMTRLPAARREGAGGQPIRILVFGQAMSAFLIVSYTICILGYLLFPGFSVQHEVLSVFLPGFTLLSWHSYFLGLAESFLWGWYIAVMFGLLYNFFLRRAG